MPLPNDLPGPVASATKNFATQIGTTHAVYAIPDDWKSRKIDCTVRAAALNSAGMPASVWLLFGTGATVEADRSAFVTGTPPAWTGSPKIARPIRDGETRDYYVDPAWTHFSIESDVASTEFYVTPSDYPKNDTHLA